MKVVQLLVMTSSRVRPQCGWLKLGVSRGHGRRVPDTESQEIGSILCVNDGIIKTVTGIMVERWRDSEPTC